MPFGKIRSSAVIGGYGRATGIKEWVAMFSELDGQITARIAGKTTVAAMDSMPSMFDLGRQSSGEFQP
jgi:hypothetical protein